jgi:hypothetical protein
VVQRFFQEARAVNTIGNEHIVEIHDFGVSPEGDHFYIMEYLDGRTLASILSQETALDVMRALHVGAQIAKALAAAHAAAVIHRDLKPDNIMLMTRLGDPDFVKVLDFGLAKILADTSASAVKTAMGVLLGTPQYMSPEACESKRDVDHRTDIYALGVLLFQMMTGVLPFDGDSMGEVLVKQVTALPPAPRGLNPAIPPSVEQVLLRCLAKPPDGRFQTMMALREALLDPEAYLRASPPIAPARSVGPGEAKVDARTMLMHTGALQQKTRIADAAAADAMQRQRLGHLPMTEGNPRGPAAVAAGPAGQPTVVAQGGYVPPPRLPTGAVVVPGLAPPAEPINNTMRIGTPLGYSSRPPRRMWPIVLVCGVVLGLGAGAFAVAWSGRGRSEGEGAGASGSSGSDGAAGTQGSAGSAEKTSAGAGSASTGSAGSGSAVAGGSGSGSAGSGGGGGGGSAGSGSGSAAPAPALAKLTIESVPRGAAVYALDGKLLGKTPLKLNRPVSSEPMAFELRLPGYRRRTKEIIVGGDTTVRIELEPLPPPPFRPPGPGSGRPPGSGSGDSGLMRPQ